jgi:hypothetical protein
LSEILKVIMAEKEEALAKRDKQRYWEKDVTCATFIDLTKKAHEIKKTIHAELTNF